MLCQCQINTVHGFTCAHDLCTCNHLKCGSSMSSDRQSECDCVTTATSNSSTTSSATAQSGEDTRTPVETDGSPLAKRRRTNSGERERDGSKGTPDALSSASANTEASTRWALSNFNLWREERNTRFRGDSENQVPADLLKSTDLKLLSKWLSLYAAETQKQDGGVYPPKTLSHLLSGISRYMRSLNPACPNIMDSSNAEFRSLHELLENISRERQTSTSMLESKPSKRFSKEEEDRLWSSGVLSTNTPKGLLRAVLVLNGRHFGIVGGEKHRQLKLSQLKRVAHPPRYEYTRCVPENQAIGDLISSHTLCIDAKAEKGNRCHVYVLDLYLQKLPIQAFKSDVFYLQPVASFTDPSKPWFTTSPVGRDCLSRMIKEMKDPDVPVDGQCLRAQQTQPAPLQAPPVAMIPHALVVQALLEAQARELRNTALQPPITQSQTIANHQQPHLVHTTHPTCTTAHTNTAPEHTVSQSTQTTTTLNSPQPTTLSVQGVAPHNFTFNNCSVTIFVTPPQSQQENNV